MIKKLQQSTWDNWLIYGTLITMAFMGGYGLVEMMRTPQAFIEQQRVIIRYVSKEEKEETEEEQEKEKLALGKQRMQSLNRLELAY